MKLIFWVDLIIIFYIYAGYCVLLFILAMKNNSVKKSKDYQPDVTILISAYNEASCIAGTLENKFELDYPKSKLEIIVVSDESTDMTDEIVKKVADSSEIPVKLVRQIPRKGKTSGLNLIAPMAKGEIIVFSDANSIFDKSAVRKLVQNFADPEVGYVTGKMIYLNSDGSMTGDGCTAYMKYENWLRKMETKIGSVVGVDGGIDAIRSTLYEKLNNDQLPDFVQPLYIINKGYRVVYEPKAILREMALSDAESEYKMRVRVSLRSLWALWDMKKLFNPLSTGIYSVQLISHKLLRYLAFIPIITLAAVNTVLTMEGGIYVFTLVIQIIFYLLAFIGYIKKGNKNISFIFAIPVYFSLLNIASANATWKFLRGQKQVLWTPRIG